MGASGEERVEHAKADAARATEHPPELEDSHVLLIGRTPAQGYCGLPGAIPGETVCGLGLMSVFAPSVTPAPGTVA